MKQIFKNILSSLLVLIAVPVISHAHTEARATAATPDIKGEEVTYKDADGTVLKGYVAYDAASSVKRPVVLVVPEWWGMTEYVRSRARQLAELGYIAMAVDMYGGGKEATSVEEAQKFSGECYKNPDLCKARLDAAEKKVKEYPSANPRDVAAIGYCFGGTMALKGATMGMDFKGVVSFHGGLAGVRAAPSAVKGKVLVCQGGADKFVSEEDVNNFKRNFDSAGVKYSVKVYPGASHAFTNPDATANGKKFNLPIAYNPEADKRSWNDMKVFLRNVFYSK